MQALLDSARDTSHRDWSFIAREETFARLVWVHEYGNMGQISSCGHWLCSKHTVVGTTLVSQIYGAACVYC